MCGSRFSIQPLHDVAHLLAAGALKQSVVENGLALVRHNTHEAHRRTAARAMWRTDRERLGLGISGWHLVPPAGGFLPENYGAKWPCESRENTGQGSGPARGLGGGKRCGSSAGGSPDCQFQQSAQEPRGRRLILVSGSRVPPHSRHGKPRLRWRRSEDRFRRCGRRAPARSTGTGYGRRRSEAP